MSDEKVRNPRNYNTSRPDIGRYYWHPTESDEFKNPNSVWKPTLDKSGNLVTQKINDLTLVCMEISKEEYKKLELVKENRMKARAEHLRSKICK